MTSSFELKVNGRAHQVQADENDLLLYVLRNDLDCKGVRFGCAGRRAGRRSVRAGRCSRRTGGGRRGRPARGICCGTAWRFRAYDTRSIGVIDGTTFSPATTT